MSPEKFHDAMNYLDDDLIAETDELRQGRRARPAARRVIPWVAAAASLALVIGIGSGTLPVWQTNNSAPAVFDGILDVGNGSGGESAMESAQGTTSHSTHEAPENWERVTHEKISLAVPAGWGYELTMSPGGGYAVAVCPGGAEGMIRVSCQPGFGVCGTGLQEKQTTIAGRTAFVGYYNASRIWSFITFPGTDYVIVNDGADNWFEENEETIAKLLETIEFMD